MAGGVVWLVSEGLGTIGTLTQIPLLISAPDRSIALFEGEPIISSWVEPLAASLRVIVQARVYACAVTRHSAGSAYVASAAYVNTQV
jgi:hypothetical protein